MILSSPLQLKNKPVRIVSLVPSQTELLHYLNLQEETVGITKFCIHPASWHSTKIKVGGTKTIDIEKITGLRPDLIIANKEENVKEQVEMLATIFPVWVTDVNDLQDALQMITDIGMLTQKQGRAQLLALQIKNNFALLSTELTTVAACYLIWRDPYITVGADTFINSMMRYAGFQNVFENEKRYPTVTISQIKASGCSVIILSSEPYPFKEKHIAELKAQLPDVKFVLADGEMFSWYGNRLLHAPPYFKSLRKQVEIL
jgi:ABC-type Fe3+-hydroxamate transport system substrate-binding protein